MTAESEQKKFEKPLDKHFKVWYNKNVPKGYKTSDSAKSAKKGIDTMTKMTYVDALNTALTFNMDNETKEKLTALRDQLIKRNSAEHKPTKTQVANEGLKGVILEVVKGADHALTISEMLTMSETLAPLSNQKVSAIANAMVKDGTLIKVPDGRKTTFTLAE